MGCKRRRSLDISHARTPREGTRHKGRRDARPYEAGKITVKVAPFFGSLSTVMTP